MRAMDIAGLGGGCVQTYEALLEIAAVVKAINNYPDYTPKLTSKLLARAEGREEVYH